MSNATDAGILCLQFIYNENFPPLWANSKGIGRWLQQWLRKVASVPNLTRSDGPRGALFNSLLIIMTMNRNGAGGTETTVSTDS